MTDMCLFNFNSTKRARPRDAAQFSNSNPLEKSVENFPLSYDGTSHFGRIGTAPPAIRARGEIIPAELNFSLVIFFADHRKLN
jgi:hypothetical protein